MFEPASLVRHARASSLYTDPRPATPYGAPAKSTSLSYTHLPPGAAAAGAAARAAGAAGAAAGIDRQTKSRRSVVTVTRAASASPAPAPHALLWHALHCHPPTRHPGERHAARAGLSKHPHTGTLPFPSPPTR